MSEIRVTSVVGENGGDRVGLTTGLTVGPLTGTTGIGATITHQGHAQFAGVCTATNVSAASSVTAATFYGSGANLTNVTTRTTGNEVTLTNQSTVDFTGFGTLRRFDIMVNRVSTSGPDWGVRLGTSGGIKTSGYNAGSGYIRSSDNVTENQTTGFFSHGLGAADYSTNGYFSFNRIDTANVGQHKWFCKANLSEYQTYNHLFIIFGYATMNAEITTIRLMPESGTFDSGEFHLITYTD